MSETSSASTMSTALVTPNATQNSTEVSNTTLSATTGGSTTQQTTIMMVYPTSPETSTAPNVGIVVGASIGGTLLVIVVLLAVLQARRKYLKKASKPLPTPLPNPDDIDKIAMEANKKSKKKKKWQKQYEKDPTSTISVEPEAPSCPAFMAPDPPSTSSVDYENAPSKRKQIEKKSEPDPPPGHKVKEPGYVNTPRGKVKVAEDGYVAAKENNARLYTTGEGAEYYVCDDDKNTKNSKLLKFPPRNPLEDSVTSTCSAMDYVNLHANSKFLEFVPESVPVDEPQDLYEPMNS